jgi:hypothetical protein
MLKIEDYDPFSFRDISRKVYSFIPKLRPYDGVYRLQILVFREKLSAVTSQAISDYYDLAQVYY